MYGIKRYGYIYEKIYDYDNLKLAHQNARKGKTHYKEVKEVDENLEECLMILQNALIWQTYQTSNYEVFKKICGEKEREIYKLPYYPDRILHWAVIQQIEPIFLKRLNGCTHSAIPKRGIHSAFKQLNRYMTNGDLEGTKYCLKMDVKKFYPSINHNLLKETYRSMFKDKDLLWLLDEIIDSTEGNVGIPIGNYLSQYSGNLFLARFDRYLKEELGLKYYSRYMDDLVILHGDKEYLHQLRKDINDYFNESLSLTVKENWQVFPSRVRGIDFVGYRHFGDYVLLRKSIANKLKRTMGNIHKKINSGENISFTDYCSVNSYKGWLKWCDAHNLYLKWIKPLEPYCDKYHKEVIKNESVQ